MILNLWNQTCNISNKESPVSKDFQRDVEPSPVKKVKKFSDLQALVDVTSYNPAAPSRDQHVPMRQKLICRKAELSRAYKKLPLLMFYLPLTTNMGRVQGLGTF